MAIIRGQFCSPWSYPAYSGRYGNFHRGKQQSFNEYFCGSFFCDSCTGSNEVLRFAQNDGLGRCDGPDGGLHRFTNFCVGEKSQEEEALIAPTLRE